ncbi:MAG: sigma 54-interacting transcriptional regulator [Pseudomonadota bacterium]
MPAAINEATLSLERDSGRIIDCNGAAADLLGQSEETVRGSVWPRVMICEGGSGIAVRHALEAGKRVFLPPFILRRIDGRELAVGGLVLPVESQVPALITLMLWPLLDEAQLTLSEAVAPSDTVAVLAVDQLRYHERWGPRETRNLIKGITASLRDIVRQRDVVLPASGASIVIVLRDVDIDGARDISRALLSHLHRVHTRPGSPAESARLCVGLAHMSPEQSALATLLAANSALLQAQKGVHGEQIRAAADDDYQLLIGHLMNNTGVFSDEFPRAELPVPSPSSTPEQAYAEPPTVAPIEKDIEGYVVDNMEGAVDQALFLAQLDVPVAILGPAGTGKMYVARVIHEATGAAPEMLTALDCREFRSRADANRRIARELAGGAGRTLVFKSPHLMSVETQQKLARQISTRVLMDADPPQSLPQVKLIALFPDGLEVLLRKAQLHPQLASAFAGYPISVPPIRDRKQAVLRWAHKILGQEGAQRDREMRGFTPDAQQAMLLYDWPGNISEMRQCISDALDKTDKDWLTPVDLGLFKGIDPEGTPLALEPKPFLAGFDSDEHVADEYTPTAEEAVNIALGEAVHSLLELDMIKPLGSWLEDDIVLAALDRYRTDLRRTGEFLHTKPRNIGRWLPKIESRDDERNSSSLWQNPRRLLREWVRESAVQESSPLRIMQSLLLRHVEQQAAALSTAKRANIMGVSTPTYLKRVSELTGS